MLDLCFRRMQLWGGAVLSNLQSNSKISKSPKFPSEKLSGSFAAALLASVGLALSGCSPAPSSTASVNATSTSTSNTAASGEPAEQTLPKDAGTQADTEVATVKIIPVDFAGFEAEIKKHAGKLVVCDVWSTGCPPCMREYPNLVALSKRWPNEVVCVSYNVDYIGLKSKPVETYLPKVSAFLEKQKSTGVVNLISSEADSDVFEKLEIASIPVVILYDREGKPIKKFTEANSGEDGLTYEADIVPAIEAALK